MEIMYYFCIVLNLYLIFKGFENQNNVSVFLGLLGIGICLCGLYM